MHIHSLHIYPVKSLRGCDVTSVEIDELGFFGDRRFLVVGRQGEFLTQRTIPAMATVSTALSKETLTLSAEDHGSISVSRASDPHAPLMTVNVWRDSNLLAEDCGNEVASWLEHVLGVRCRLVRIGGRFHRPVTKPAAVAGDLVSFADAAPILVASTSSLDELNNRIQARGGEPVPMNRFRPNLVIESCEPFTEDEWPAVRIGSVILRNAGPSERCIMTTTDQYSGRRGAEPLRTLATFRRTADGNAVCFGVNFIQQSKCGTLHAGDLVEVAAS